ADHRQPDAGADRRPRDRDRPDAPCERHEGRGGPQAARRVHRRPGLGRGVQAARAPPVRRLRVRHPHAGGGRRRARPGRRRHRLDRLGLLDPDLDGRAVPRGRAGGGLLHPRRPRLRHAQPDGDGRAGGGRHRRQRQVGLHLRRPPRAVAGDHRDPRRRRGRALPGGGSRADRAAARRRRLAHQRAARLRQRQHDRAGPLRAGRARAAAARRAAGRGRGHPDPPPAAAAGRVRVVGRHRAGPRPGRAGDVPRPAARPQDHLHGLRAAERGSADPPPGGHGGAQGRPGRVPRPPPQRAGRREGRRRQHVDARRARPGPGRPRCGVPAGQGGRRRARHGERRFVDLLRRADPAHLPRHRRDQPARADAPGHQRRALRPHPLRLRARHPLHL
ncbi:MAG: Acyl-CoA dehydrogenase, type 2-like, partial [uncultured Pseudonocardia sp.]